MTPLEACTQLLVHFNEASGYFTDSSSARRLIEAPPTGPLPDADAKFGAGCASFAGASSTFYRVVAPFNGTGPFFMEAWVKPSAARSVVTVVFGASVQAAIGINSIAGGAQWYGTVWDGNNSGSAIFSPAAAALDVYTHVLFGQDETLTRRLFVAGTQVATGAPIAFPKSAQLANFAIGGNGSDGNTVPIARVDELRYVVGYPCPTEDFTPPVAPYADLLRSSLSIQLARQQSPIFAGAPPATSARLGPQPAVRVLDTIDGGRGMIVGTVKKKALPVNLPLRCRVRLIHEHSGRFIRETWSSEAGDYVFLGIDPSQRYTVLTYDHEGNFRAVAANSLVPEPMP